MSLKYEVKYFSKWHMVYTRHGESHRVNAPASIYHDKDMFWYEYNSDGDVIYERNSNGDEEWYDNSGNLIRYRNSDGFEAWSERHSNGYLSHYRDNKGNEYWFDENGNRIHDNVS